MDFFKTIKSVAQKTGKKTVQVGKTVGKETVKTGGMMYKDVKHHYSPGQRMEREKAHTDLLRARKKRLQMQEKLSKMRGTGFGMEHPFTTTYGPKPAATKRKKKRKKAVRRRKVRRIVTTYY